MSKSLCCIEKCLTKSSSIKVKDIIYYLFPTDADWASKWEKKVKEFDPSYIRKSDDKICSLHFAKSSMKPITRQLVDHAVPIYFPLSVKSKTEPSVVKITQANLKAVHPISDICCINDCSTKFTNDSKIIGFKFPPTENRRKLWIYFIRLHNGQILDWNAEMKICGLHFPKSDFLSPNCLSETAKPTVFGAAIQRRRIEIAQQKTVPKTQIVYRKKDETDRNSPNAQTISQSATITNRRLSLPYPKLALKPKEFVRKSISNISLPMKKPQTNKLAEVIPNKSLPDVSIETVPVLDTVKFTNLNAHRSESLLKKTRPAPNSQVLLNNMCKEARKEVIIGIDEKGVPKFPTVKTVFQSTSNVKTYSKRNSSTTEAQSESNLTSVARLKPVKLSSDVIIIDENDLSKKKPTVGTINLGDSTESLNISIIKRPGERRHYVIKSEEALNFPRILANRIRDNKRKNDATFFEVLALKKRYHKLANEIRLRNATNVVETIDLS